MSVAVDLATLHEQIERFGARALLASTAADGPPHVSSVLVTVEVGVLIMGAGRKSRANAAAHPAVSVVWTHANEHEYCLIVDGLAAENDAGAFVVTPTSAILHRLANLGSVEPG